MTQQDLNHFINLHGVEITRSFNKRSLLVKMEFINGDFEIKHRLKDDFVTVYPKDIELDVQNISYWLKSELMSYRDVKKMSFDINSDFYGIPLKARFGKTVFKGVVQ